MSTNIGEVSSDWAQLSLLGDGGSIDRPEGDGTEVQSRPGNQSGRRPQCETWATRGPYMLLHSAEMAAGVLSPKPCKSEAQGETGTCGLASFSGTWH